MRAAHLATIPQWSESGVWKVFDRIRRALGLGWDQVASVNLARCFDPEPDAMDDRYIPGCQRSWPLDDLVHRLEARIVFLARAGPVGKQIRIFGEEDGAPLVVRYATSWSGQRNGRYYRDWIPAEAPGWRELLAKNRCEPNTLER
jgi:hypothetical protein